MDAIVLKRRIRINQIIIPSVFILFYALALIFPDSFWGNDTTLFVVLFLVSLISLFKTTQKLIISYYVQGEKLHIEYYTLDIYVKQLTEEFPLKDLKDAELRPRKFLLRKYSRIKLFNGTIWPSLYLLPEIEKPFLETVQPGKMY